MARLACETKMGFYPTSTLSIKKVIEKTIIFPEKEIYALDCCAGEGEAIEMIGSEYNCKTYAVELDENRSKIAVSRNIDKVLNTDAINGVRKSNHWAGFNFLNPPYDISASGSRLELDFIERWGLTTTIGGVMMLVINPSSADEKMANALRLQGYRPMYSFYDPENEDYKSYGQFFIILHKQLPTFRASVQKFFSLFENPLDINSTDENDIDKINIRTGVAPKMFIEINIPRWKIEKQLDSSNLKRNFFRDLRDTSFQDASIEYPNEGQAAILIANGALNKTITLVNGDKVILKGTSFKEQKKEEQMGEETGTIDNVKVTDFYKTIVYGLNLTHGQFIKYE